MKILIDTNILISACLFKASAPAKAFAKALTPPHTAVICRYSLDEVNNVVARKFPNKSQDMAEFLYKLLLSCEFVGMSHEAFDDETKIRDIKDRPILRTAIACGADAILTGDKDFLESDITAPRMLKASEFARETDDID